MRASHSFIASIAAVAIVSAQDQVSFELRPKLDGEYIDLYMHQTRWSDMSVEQNSEGSDVINMYDRDRAYISWSKEPHPDKYFKPNLLGGYVTYDVNLSSLPCGCITALYQVLMPAKLENGDLWERDYWYCGAQ